MSNLDIDFDPDALREKYAQERDKRLRPDASGQYLKIEGDFSYLEQDPFVEERIEREPLNDDIDVALIGGGFGGLLAGARLRQLGVKDIRIIDKGGDVGGTWYFNRYPGAACDIESYVYLPLLEETGYIPSQKYATGTEIFEYCQSIAKKYDLYNNSCLQTTVEELRWDESSQRWIIKTDRGDEMRARFVSMANGYLQKPKLPGIPGIDTFKGKMFHTCRWDYDYTGGSPEGKLSGLADKRVGIIGTGATAVQCIPHLGASAEQLYVFQRTPSSIGVRDNRPTDPEWVKTLKPGWHKERVENFHTLTAGGYVEEDLVADGWTDITKILTGLVLNDESAMASPEALAETFEIADMVNMQKLRARVDDIVKDDKTAEALKPWYRQFCKRPCFHDEYLQTFNRENVTLVDTNGQGVERITEHGVVVDGVEYDIDCLVLASGFEVGTEYGSRAGFEPIGIDGKTLTEHWSGGARTLHGIHMHGFPNCYLMGIIQSGFTVNFVHMLDEMAQQIAYTIHQCLEQGITRLEVSHEAEQAWVDSVFEHSDEKTAEFSSNCTPGYYNNEGKVKETSRVDNFYNGAQPDEYINILEAWRDAGDLAGMNRS